MHIYGVGLQAEIQKVEGYEKDTIHKLRVQYGKSNKDLFGRLKRPVDKVLSARGGSVYYNMSDALNRKATQAAMNVRDGLSVRKWMEVYWLPHFLDDPNGVVFMEVGDGVDTPLGVTYPTYKPITAIYDYQVKGSQLDYIVFELSPTEKKKLGLKPEWKAYRVVDDAADYIVKQENAEAVIIDEHTLPNVFEEVPAILNSDFVSPQNSACRLSLFDDVIELASHFLLKGSIKTTHDFLHGFPKYWEYLSDCNACDGSGMKNAEKCEKCKGSGKAIMSKVSDSKGIAWPKDKETPIITPDVAGYISPDKTFHEISTADLEMLEDLMSHTLWGTGSTKKPAGPTQVNKESGQKTATEVIDDMQPKIDRLHPISEAGEKRHKFIIDKVVTLQIQPNYPGSSVNWGRRYITESPDKIWEKYSDARTKGGAMSVLDDLLLEYYEAKYASDPVKLAIQVKLMKVEPFVHLTSQQIDTSTSVTPADKTAKAYFSEWLSAQTEGFIVNAKVDVLRQSLTEFVAEKAAKIEADIKAQQDAKTTKKAA